MLLVEGTLLPLIVVGAVSDACAPEVLMTVDEERLWSVEGLYLALVVSGRDGGARRRQRELFGWLRRHRGHLWRRAVRIAFVIEDDTLRSCADTWLEIAAARLCQGEVLTFGALKPALTWLVEPGGIPSCRPS